MKSEFIAGKNNSEKIKKLVHNDIHSVAVAFWGESFVDDIIAGKKQPRIICNLYSGGCNPKAIRKLLENGYHVKYLNNLHAKVYIGEQSVIVGSANASSNGLGLENRETNGWLEASIVCTDEAVVQQATKWFESNWVRANDVFEQDIDDAENQWLRNRSKRPVQAFTNDLYGPGFDLNSLRDRRLYVAMYNKVLSKAEEKKRIQYAIDHKIDSEALDLYSDWPESINGLRVGDGLISFHVKPKSIIYGGTFMVLAHLHDENSCWALEQHDLFPFHSKLNNNNGSLKGAALKFFRGLWNKYVRVEKCDKHGLLLSVETVADLSKSS
jgi:rhodanese-related sulfurtransferase